MGDIKLAGAAWSFVGTSLIESATIWRALGIESMDLLAIPGASLDSAEIDRDPEGQARRFSEPGMDLSNLLYIFGADFADRAVNSADASVRSRNMDTLKNVLDCCTAADISWIVISTEASPGAILRSWRRIPFMRQAPPRFRAPPTCGAG